MNLIIMDSLLLVLVSIMSFDEYKHDTFGGWNVIMLIGSLINVVFDAIDAHPINLTFYVTLAILVSFFIVVSYLREKKCQRNTNSE